MNTDPQLNQRIRDLEESNQQLRRFAHLASHQLQAPARNIGNFAGLLSKRYAGELDEKADDWLDRIVRSTHLMQATVKNLVRYCEVGSRATSRETIVGNQVLDNLLASLQPIIDQSEIAVSCEPLPEFKSDPDAFAFVLENLISNALKFTRGHGNQVRISAEHHNKGWIFCVADDGIGIAPQHHEEIFQPFVCLHPPSEFEGTGINLATCRAMLRQQGGKIWVESQPGLGSSFYFLIPEEEVNG